MAPYSSVYSFLAKNFMCCMNYNILHGHLSLALSSSAIVTFSIAVASLFSISCLAASSTPSFL